MSFPKDFLWGAAAAAYQIEGAAMEDGRGLSIWDVYSHDKNVDSGTGRMNIDNGDTGDVACDHYHRYKEDVALMKEIGLKAYRLSISWSRVLPEGKGKINEKGLDFYGDLVDELLKAGIEPYVTLFHWDLPQALMNLGGWSNPDSPDWFAEYVKVVTDKLSDRVTHWITFNESQCHIIIGHLLGECAPKLKLPYPEVFQAMHHLFLAHGKAVQTIRKYSAKPCMVGYAPCASEVYPVTDKKEDIDAARRAAFDASAKNLWNTSWWIDPIVHGRYPKEGIEAFAEYFPEALLKEEDLALISQPLDFLGINLYRGSGIRHTEEGYVQAEKKIGFDRTAFKWPVTPKVLHYMPKFLFERYHLPVLITENGLSMADWVSLDGKVHDPQRIDFMNRYLLELSKALDEGVNVVGYFAWSIMDNFEWSQGYGERFGLIHVDFETQKRTLKDSAYWYRDIITSNGEGLQGL
ncbi:GH1 family beta-glucosidase [Anaerocolumna xylanovorans]|uniref:Beta-glucosidase n=1 Tax=Anaerocolumna xylanovorans DSM 12503 TaxID=1121345 RepID=A0A1M7Y4I8_9FIRM|nr:GH1 family beta-glucosidase [Anaerocolumna xylanovorans]SHO47229.1 beta-glucosidase [Anaerocolumna xylanovorans DSM 12503]